MKAFDLDERLRADCETLFETDRCSYLLHRNASIDWFILVPHIAETEFYRLEQSVQQDLCADISRVSDFICSQLGAEKMNVATLGNVVEQMHIHVIGRYRSDPYWPDAVWGRPVEKTHDTAAVQSIRKKFVQFMRRD